MNQTTREKSSMVVELLLGSTFEQRLRSEKKFGNEMHCGRISGTKLQMFGPIRALVVLIGLSEKEEEKQTPA